MNEDFRAQLLGIAASDELSSEERYSLIGYGLRVLEARYVRLPSSTTFFLALTVVAFAALSGQILAAACVAVVPMWLFFRERQYERDKRLYLDRKLSPAAAQLMRKLESSRE